MPVWVGDDSRKLATGQIEPTTTARADAGPMAATRWPAATAARLFPKSRFAQERRITRLPYRG